MDELTRLVALEEIKRLKAQYFRTVDSKDWEGYGRVFTEDAVLDMTEEMKWHAQESLDTGAEALVHGRADIVGVVSGALKDAISVHEGGMPIIDVHGSDSASGTWQVHDWVELPESAFQGYGHYYEEYRQIDGRWMISLMRITRLRLEWSKPAS